MKGYEIRFNIYADSEQEVEEARKAIVRFIAEHASEGRAVTAGKVAHALGMWKENVLVRNKIISYFK